MPPVPQLSDLVPVFFIQWFLHVRLEGPCFDTLVLLHQSTAIDPNLGCSNAILDSSELWLNKIYEFPLDLLLTRGEDTDIGIFEEIVVLAPSDQCLRSTAILEDFGKILSDFHWEDVGGFEIASARAESYIP